MNDIGMKKIEGIHIPACPVILTQLIDELKHSITNSKKIAALVGQDVGLSSIVIRTANSPLIGCGRRIDSIANAVKILGFDTLTNLVREALLQNSILGNGVGFERFWDSSRYTAIAGKRLAGVVGKVHPDTAYTFGLFHDCGIPLLIQRFPEYKKVLQQANQDTERAFTEIEEEAIDTSHAVLGYYLARTWGLSDAIAQGILNHHDYKLLGNPLNIDSESCHLIAVNVMAEHIARTHLRTETDMEWQKARGAVSISLGYLASDLDDIVADIIYQFDETLARHEDLE